MFTRILVPTDFSGPSDAALVYAKSLAAHFGASLHLVHVLEDQMVTGVYVPESPGFSTARREDAERQLATRLTPLERRRLAATTDILGGTSARTIVETARDRGIDLIVMGTHGRTGVAHALMGSVAERVVRMAHCPVFTTHEVTAPAVETARAWTATLASA